MPPSAAFPWSTPVDSKPKVGAESGSRTRTRLPSAVFEFAYGVCALVRGRSPRIQIGPLGDLVRSPLCAQVRPNCCQTAVSLRLLAGLCCNADSRPWAQRQ